MIQRVVRNGRVRAFGAQWELDERARQSFENGETVRVLQSDENAVSLWAWNEDGCFIECYGHATRPPVVDLMHLLRESLRGSEKP